MYSGTSLLQPPMGQTEVAALRECKGGMNKSVTGGGHGKTSGHKSVMDARLHGLLQCVVCF